MGEEIFGDLCWEDVMHKESVKQKYQLFIKELENEFYGKEQGYVKVIEVGPKLFPYCLTPQLEVVLLDPEINTIVYRPVSNPLSIERKKGEWRLGKPIDAVVYVIEWAEKMKKLQSN
jgi:hypothetical protein